MSRKSGYYMALANKYISGVLSGEIPACKWVRLACQRQVNDLKKTESEAWDYHFDVDSAERVCRFVELLPHIKGPLANAKKKLTLEPWQCFILTTVFGWLDSKRMRRFRVVYTEVPRKNGKSTFSSGVALYMLAADKESGADVFSAATHRDQAKIVWADAAEMVNRSPNLRASLGVEAKKRAIFQTKTASKFVPIARESRGNHDGLNIHCAIVDELHAHKTSAIWDVLITGIGARSQPLVWAITTAGFDRTGVCYDRRTYLTRVLEGQYQDERMFGCIWTLDEGDDWKDPENWKKANPNWGVSLNEETIGAIARSAIQMNSTRNNFLTKHLNVWVNASTAWMDMLEWEKQAKEELDEADFDGVPCWLASDLATRIDVASICRLYIKDLKEKSADGTRDVMRRHYYAFFDYYVPEQTALSGHSDRYLIWESEGRFKLCTGGSIDLDIIEEDILQSCREHRVEEIVVDPWNAQQMCQHLSKRKLKIVEVRPTVSNVTEAMKELEAAVRSGRFHFNGDPILTWMVSNVVARTDSRGNIYPEKERPENKIDAVYSLLMAMARANAVVPEPPRFQAYVF
jgi:phage terminase large subunit-like protein